MKRRKLLQLTGATIATGAGAEQTEFGRQVEHDESDENEQENEDEQDEDENDEEAEPACEPEIEFGDRELLVDDTGISDDQWAVVSVENTGDNASGAITVTVEWLDEEGSRIDTDTGRLPSLGPAETWLAHVWALGPDPEEVADLEATGEFEMGKPRTPQGMTITESELEEGDFGPVITGSVENTRETGLEYVEAIGTFYDDDGAVLAGSSTFELDLAAGTDWSFEISMQPMPHQADDPAEFDVTLNGRSFQIQG